MKPAVYSAQELAQLAGVSPWSIYAAVKDGTCPFPFVRVGKRIVFPRGAVDRILCIEPESAS